MMLRTNKTASFLSFMTQSRNKKIKTKKLAHVVEIMLIKMLEINLFCFFYLEAPF